MESEKPSRNLIRWNAVIVISGFLLFGAIVLLDSLGIQANMIMVVGLFVVIFLLSIVIAWLNAKYLFGRLFGTNPKPPA